MTTAYSIEGLQELQSQPIFLSQFLKLTLPRIRTLASPSPGRTAKPQPSSTNRAYFGTSTYVATSDSPPSTALLQALPALQVSEWPSFLDSIVESLSTIQGGEHILAPPAFREDDLPIATLLPTVFLWVIVAVWQPCLRMYELDEFHIAIGAGQGEEEKRRELKVGDHLPEHEELTWAQHGQGIVGALPRQVFYTILPTTTRDLLIPPGEEEDRAYRGIKALISVEEPWNVDLSLLDVTIVSPQEVLRKLNQQAKETKDQEEVDGKMTATYSSLLKCLSSLQESKVRFAVLTTYESFLFIKVDFSSSNTEQLIDKMEISPLVKAGDALKEGKSTSVFAAMWWFGKQIMTA